MSVASMTGFTRFEIRGTDTEGPLAGAGTISLKGVNSKGLDISLRLPRKLQFLDSMLKKHIQTRIARGKVELNLEWISTDQSSELPTLNRELAEHTLELAKKVTSLDSSTSWQNISPLDVLRFDNVMTHGQDALADQEKQLSSFFETELQKALADFTKTRQAEGKTLAQDLDSKIQQLRGILSDILENRSAWQNAIITQSQKKIATLAEQLCEGAAGQQPTEWKERIALEAAVMLERQDFEEEVTRLQAHFDLFEATLHSDKPAVGKKLEFVCQELHRECNTMGNKLRASSGIHQVVEMKTIVDQLKQQIANIQ